MTVKTGQRKDNLAGGLVDNLVVGREGEDALRLVFALNNVSSVWIHFHDVILQLVANWLVECEV